MESVTSSISLHKASNYDELSMQQSIQFLDSLKDLRSIKKQLYSAAEYFESSYRNHEEKQVVMTTVKDYTLKAFINTVDHLGSMSYKVNCLLNDKSQELSTIELPFSCIEQRLRTCRQFVNHGGLSTQSFMVETPKYHTRYILPEEMYISSRVDSKFAKTRADTEMDRNDLQTRGGKTSMSVNKEQFSLSVDSGTFSFTKASPNRRPERRETSPYRFNLTRSGSVNRSASPNPANTRRRSPSEPRRSLSPFPRPATERRSDVELYVSKNKRMFKALLGMRKQKQDGNGRFYKYLDEE